MMDNDNSTDKDLEAFFAEARAQPPQMPEALLARVISDAEAQRPAPVRPGTWRDWFTMIGGLPGAAALVTASCVGFWIGIAPPEGLPDLAGTMLGGAAVEEEFTDGGLNGFGWDIGEG